MQVSRTPVALLSTKRIDPDYYAPIHVADEAAIRAVGGIELGSAGRLFAGPFGSELPTSAFTEQGVPLVRVANVGEMEFEHRGLARIPAELHERLGASEVIPGDLLVVKASVGEKVCLVPDEFATANITQHIIGLRPNGSIDLAYVAAVLFCGYGRRQLQRRALGALIQYLGVQEARTVLLPAVDPAVQAYIGSKVRQAETLREWARSMRDSAYHFVRANFVEPSLSSLRDRPRRMHASLLGADSLDPHFAIAEQGHRLMSSAISIDEMKAACRSGDPIRSDERESGPYPYHGASGPIDRHSDWNIDGQFILVAQDGSIGRSCVVRGRAWANNHVWILTLKPGFDLDAVSLFLSEFYPYWQGLTTGSVVPKVLADNLLRIRVPEVVARAVNEVGEPLRSAKAAEGSARALVAAARLLVEALIERKVTEAELIAASKDAEADRVLLARLKDDGLDGTGAPLFPDLNALADLLTEAIAPKGEAP